MMRQHLRVGLAGLAVMLGVLLANMAGISSAYADATTDPSPPGTTAPSAPDPFGNPFASSGWPTNGTTAPGDSLLQASTAPTELTAKREGGSLSVSWKPPPQYESAVIRYNVRLGDQVVATTSRQLGSIPTHVTVPALAALGGGAVTVTATFNSNAESQRSNAVTVEPIATAAPADPSNPAATPDPNNPAGSSQTTAPAPPPAPPPISGNIFGGGVILPGSSVKNNPDELEDFGLNAAYTHLINTYGTEIVNPMLNNVAEWFWEQATSVKLSGMATFAWATTPYIYDKIGDATADLIKQLGISDLFLNLLAISILAVLVWGIVQLRNHPTLIYKAVTGATLIIALAIGYVWYASAIVPRVVTSPVTAVQFVVLAQDGITGSGGNLYELGLKHQGTFDTGGTDAGALEQGIRFRINYEFNYGSYVDWCQIQFGNAKAALAAKIPDSEPNEKYRGMSICEAALTAGIEGNTDMQNALRSDQGVGGVGALGGNTGYVEQASPEMWHFYAGESPLTRAWYAMISGGSNVLTGSIDFIIGFVTFGMVIFMAWDCFVLLLRLALGAYPEFQRDVPRHLKGMGRRLSIPAIITFGLLTCQKLIDAFIVAWGPSGWLITTVIRAALTALLLIYLLVRLVMWFWLQYHRMKNRLLAHDLWKERPPLPPLPPPPPPVYVSVTPVAIPMAPTQSRQLNSGHSTFGGYGGTRPVISPSARGSVPVIPMSPRPAIGPSVVDADPRPPSPTTPPRRQLEPAPKQLEPARR